MTVLLQIFQVCCQQATFRKVAPGFLAQAITVPFATPHSRAGQPVVGSNTRATPLLQ